MTTQAFVSWQASLADLVELDERAEEPLDGTSPFAIDASINRRIVLVRAAEPWKLAVDALVISNNEALSDRSGVTGEIFKHGGAAFERDVLALETVRTGEAKDTSGHGLTARRAIHAVGPRYRERYVAAAESALHWSYRTALQLCRDQGLRTAAMLPLHDVERKHFPREEGTHAALRTIRKFFERNPSAIDVLLLLLPSADDLEAYSRAMPLYFPRTQAEVTRTLEMAAARRPPASLPPLGPLSASCLAAGSPACRPAAELAPPPPSLPRLPPPVAAAPLARGPRGTRPRRSRRRDRGGRAPDPNLERPLGVGFGTAHAAPPLHTLPRSKRHVERLQGDGCRHAASRFAARRALAAHRGPYRRAACGGSGRGGEQRPPSERREHARHRRRERGRGTRRLRVGAAGALTSSGHGR